jgi:adenine/guanine phosphoribosyltransferase-like PRPP-binding protein
VPLGPFNTYRKAALVAGHPGHELKVFGWLSQYKPRVYVLTDGSGRQGVSRLSSTLRVLEPLGIATGKVFGLISDRELYRALLAGEASSFLAILDRLIDSFIANDIDLVVADATEGFNPGHDLCRTLVDAAVITVERKTGRRIANYQYCLTEWERVREAHHDETCSHLVLDDDTLRRKIEAAGEYVELENEVREATSLRGTEYFRVECLQRVVEPFCLWAYPGRPHYEVWGERRVAEGAYASVIRYEQHVLPMIAAIRGHALGSEACPVGSVAARS